MRNALQYLMMTLLGVSMLANYRLFAMYRKLQQDLTKDDYHVLKTEGLALGNIPQTQQSGILQSLWKMNVTETFRRWNIISNKETPTLFQPYEHNGGSVEVKRLKDYVEQMNSEQRIRNLDRFSLSSDSEGLVILVQAHDRTAYLKHLIESLRRAKGIETTLLIFSHDYVSKEMNSVINTIDFCLFTQIFYPLSTQLYPDSFPGLDPHDCPPSFKPSSELERKGACLNVQWPDSYGHYRNHNLAQVKHHWFWKMNFVFGNLRVTSNFTGYVTLLEEDHIVTPDFIYLIRKMSRLTENSFKCKGCNVFTLARTFSLKAQIKKPLASVVEISEKMLGAGFTVNRQTWHEIRSCARHFCDYDDYNWDFSLWHVGYRAKCMKKRLIALVPKIPRVYHIGQCGMHGKLKDCSQAIKKALLDVKEKMKQYGEFYFPDKVKIGNYVRLTNKTLARWKPNGGWGDLRDRELCLKFSQL